MVFIRIVVIGFDTFDVWFRAPIQGFGLKPGVAAGGEVGPEFAVPARLKPP